MAAREPQWWYGTMADGWVPYALAPVATLYGAVAARRMQAPHTYRAAIPVIAIGNFTAGGTGKTPFVRVVVDALRAVGHRPVVLSRGYGGTTRGPCWVVVERDTAEVVGDEPLLLASGAPVMVAKDRAAGARAIEAATGLHASVIVMDDGLQNPTLATDLSIAVVDAVRGFGNGRCIPAGPLRAPLAAQLARVDAVLLNGGDGLAPLAASAAALARSVRQPLLSARVAPAGDVAWLQGQPVIAFAGIGVPARFVATLEAAGAIVREAISFADHHAYTDADATDLLARARAARATLITTEKDCARLKGRTGALARLHDASRVLPIRLLLDDKSTAALASLLADRVPMTPPV